MDVFREPHTESKILKMRQAILNYHKEFGGRKNLTRAKQDLISNALPPGLPAP